MKLNAVLEEKNASFGATLNKSNETFGASMGSTQVIHNGQNGATFTPFVSEDGVISWTNDRELENPTPVNIKGDKGDKGDQGEQGIQGVQGDKGDKGDTGANGKNGTNGVDGKDGFSPIVSVTDIEGGHRVSITDEDGAKTFDVMDGKDGQGGGGGVTSWNDLTDKPFYMEIGDVVELVSNLTADDYDKGNYPPCNFIVGEKYTVIWNGEEYNDLVCYSDGPYNCIGGDGNPFYIDDNGGNSLFIDGGGDFTVVTIVGPSANVKTLDIKYLPNTVVSDEEMYAALIDELYNYDLDIKSRGYQTEAQVKALIDEAGEAGGGGVTSWNDLTDKPSFAVVSTSGDYNDLENVPVGIDLKYLLEETQVTFTAKQVCINPNVWQRLLNYANKISFNGKLFNAVFERVSSDASILGNPYLYNDNKEDNGLPITFVIRGEANKVYSLWVHTRDIYIGQTCTVAAMEEKVHQLDEKFLPDSVVLESELEGKGYQTEAQVTALINNAISNLPKYNGEVEEI